MCEVAAQTCRVTHVCIKALYYCLLVNNIMSNSFFVYVNNSEVQLEHVTRKKEKCFYSSSTNNTKKVTVRFPLNAGFLCEH